MEDHEHVERERHKCNNVHPKAACNLSVEKVPQEACRPLKERALAWVNRESSLFWTSSLQVLPSSAVASWLVVRLGVMYI